jgi:hypothetical protein
MTVPDVPATMGTILAISAEKWGELAEKVGPAAGVPQSAQFGFRQEWVDYIGGRTEVDAEGRWSLELDPGEYVFCVGNLAGPPPDPESVPVSVLGCLAPLDVSAGQTALDIHVGDIGVTGR